MNKNHQRMGSRDYSVHISGPQRARLKPLFPHNSDEELNEVADVFYGYCATVWRIYERLEREHPEVIDELMRRRTINPKVDSSENETT